MDPIQSVGNAAEQVGNAMDKNFTSQDERMQNYNAGMANARDREKAALEQDDPLPKRGLYYLAFFWSAAAVIYFFAVTFFTVPEANQHNSNTILGFLLGTIVAAIINYFFGSSYSSSTKTRQTDGLLNRMFTRKDKKTT